MANECEEFGHCWHLRDQTYEYTIEKCCDCSAEVQLNRVDREQGLTPDEAMRGGC